MGICAMLWVFLFDLSHAVGEKSFLLVCVSVVGTAESQALFAEAPCQLLPFWDIGFMSVETKALAMLAVWGWDFSYSVPRGSDRDWWKVL